VVETQRLLKKTQESSKCFVTGKQFAGAGSKRYLCGWTHNVTSEAGIVKSWTWADENETEKEKPLSLSKPAKEEVTASEEKLQAAIDGGELAPVLEAIKVADDNSKPVDAKLYKAAISLRDQLESANSLTDAMNNQDIIMPDVEKIVFFALLPPVFIPKQG